MPRDYTAKSDQGKTDWSLLPWKILEQMAQIMTQAIEPKEQGGKGYGLASWRTVPGGYYRYWSAFMRHATRRFVYGEVIDQESGFHHTAHMLCNIAFIGEIDIEAMSNKLSESDSVNFYERDI